MLWVFIFLVQAFSSCIKQELHLVMVLRLLISVASLVAESRFEVCRLSVVAACGVYSPDSVVVVHRLSCSMACDIFPDQGSNLCPLHWQADSHPLYHKRSPLNVWICLYVSFLLISIFSSLTIYSF